MKFFDMDIQDFYEKNLTSLVVEIFAKKLWRIDSNNHSIYLIRVLRPIDIGLRFPLNPEEKEGVVVQIGSTVTFSEKILRLKNETESIQNRSPCPKNFQTTSYEYVFREKNLFVDWCLFKLIDQSDQLEEKKRKS
ncbi:sodium- and chloride-dependent GABA transporter 1-like [Sarcoptes scabiei]|nr:sodium- and chloride-dependent GABA transporter 1-like [Sarcoptes scabiei]